MKTGITESVTLPMNNLIMEKERGQSQLQAVRDLILLANNLGLEGKRVTAIVRDSSFVLDDVQFRLSWEKRE